MAHTFSRKGTVSKSSGPTHANSYAMRGVPVRYKTPIFVPELLQLPVDWVKPTLPSSRSFNYDYSLEKRVSEQAKHRALSIAAEASLQRKQLASVLEQQEQQQQQQAKGGESPRPAHPPFMPNTTEILTPTPVGPPPASQSSPTVGGREGNVVATPTAGTAAQSSGTSSGGEGGGSSSSLIEDENPTQRQPSAPGTNKTTDIFKSLGNWSLREFEGDAMDPFEITSLQAINDMEVLESVLQPRPAVGVASPPTQATTTSSVLPASSSTPTVVVAAVALPPPGMLQSGVHSSPNLTALPNTPPSTTAATSVSYVLPTPPPSSHTAAAGVATTPVPVSETLRRVSEGSVVSRSGSGHLSMPPPTTTTTTTSTNPFLSGTTSASAIPPPSSSTATPIVSSSSYPLPPVSNTAPSPSSSAAVATATATASSSYNPFLTSEPIYGNVAHRGVVVAPPPQELSRREPGVGTLVDLSSGGSPEHVKPPIPVPRTSPKQIQRQEIPVPKPRKTSPGPTSATSSPPSGPSSRPTPGPVTQPPVSSTSPSLPPKPNLAAATAAGGVATSRLPQMLPQHSAGSSPVAQPRGAVATAASPKVTHNHIGMGVPVLPPITQPTSTPDPSLSSSSSSSASSRPSQPVAGRGGELPPAYKQTAPPTARDPSPPPPYSSPSTYHRQQPSRPPPPVALKTYVLPNPEASLSAEQKSQVQTISSMGFPAPRVARAMKRFKNDQTKILDFLFLVGELEDAKFNGDSAETALISCQEKLEEAKAYLQKLEGYKEIGFQEKDIHEAYAQTLGDWDLALDVLTRGR